MVFQRVNDLLEQRKTWGAMCETGNEIHGTGRGFTPWSFPSHQEAGSKLGHAHSRLTPAAVLERAILPLGGVAICAL